MNIQALAYMVREGKSGPGSGNRILWSGSSSAESLVGAGGGVKPLIEKLEQFLFYLSRVMW